MPWQVATENVDALLSMAESLENLVQLDLSSHYDAFYATVEGDYCPYDSLTTMACKMDRLRVLNLTENGRKFGWAQLRSTMRCINDDVEEGDISDRTVGCTIHYGDGVTVYAAGTPEAGERYARGDDDDDDDSDSYGGHYDGHYDDDDDEEEDY